MALVIKDRVKETTTTTGTGTYTLAGAVSGFETFTANLSNSDTTYYVCTDNTDFEVGLGTFTSSGTTLARTTILASSNSNNEVDWSSGTRSIFMTYPADKAVFEDASNNINGTFVGNITGNVTGNTSGTAATVTGAAQTNITSLGTLTALTVDNVAINATTIGHTDDTDLITLADGVVTVAGEISVTTLDIGGTNVTSTATELNVLDGIASIDTDISSVSGSDDTLASAKAIKTYVDAQVTAQDLDVTSDSGTIAIDLDSETLTIAGGTGLASSASSNTVTLAVDAAQTGITSLLATDIKIGEDDQTKIDFETANTINFYAGNEKQLILTDGALTPGANNILDLGSSSVEFKDAFFDGTVTSDAFAGPLTGNVTGNVSGTAATVTGAAQTNITSVGTLSSLTTSGDITVGDDLTVNGGLIDLKTNSGSVAKLKFYCESGNAHAQTLQAQPHSASASDVLTLPTGGNSTLVSRISTDTLTNKTLTSPKINEDVAVTSTATELNLLDGITGIADEDDLTSDSNTKLATQQSIKAYVDAQKADMQFVLEDGDGTEVQITKDKEVKFVEGGGLDINWTDTSTGSDGDPYDLTFTVNAAQTGITSLVNTSLEIGRDADNRIKFGTDNQIIFEVSGGDNVIFKASGEIEASSLDISGNADIDGTLEADAITVGGTALNTVIAGVTVTNATTAAVATTVTISDNESTNEENAVVFTAGGDVDGGNIGLESDGDLTYNPSTGTVSATVFKGNIDAVDGDFDGTLEADAITVAGTALATVIAGTTVTDATNSAHVLVTDNESTNEENLITFVEGATSSTGNVGLEMDGNLTYNPSTGRLTATQLAGTLQTAAQANVTSLGTLTTLTVDNVIINGSTIGHTGDTDLMTVASGVLTVAGEVDATSLDISGDADIDGTLEADAITVNGTALNTVIADEATALAIALG
jgi:cytoskeletal protein CcmA (bactofilin family)